MHFDVLVEDQSGKAAVEILLAKILDADKHTVAIYPYKGLGELPKGIKPKSGADKRILLDQLPKLLRGFGNVHSAYGDDYKAVLFVICDLDRHDKSAFMADLQKALNECSPQPNARFSLAIEEIEAWYLGDMPAILSVYPHAQQDVLKRYKNDEICGTWELLANAVFKGGASALSQLGWSAIGKEKSLWAKTICPKMNPEENKSPSFKKFRDSIIFATKGGSK
jgi:hypothetical protein